MRDYHKDALDRYNVTCDFPTVIRELVDPHKRFPFQACSPCVQKDSPGGNATAWLHLPCLDPF